MKTLPNMSAGTSIHLRSMTIFSITAVACLAAAAAPRVQLGSVSVAPGSTFLVPVSCEDTTAAQVTVLVARISLPETQVEVLEVLPDPTLVDAGKSFDYEITGDILSLCVFGGSTAIPSGQLGLLLLRLRPESTLTGTITLAAAETHGADKNAGAVTVTGTGGLITVLDGALPHKADPDGDWHISLGELLRIIQLYNMGAYHCEALTEDGFAPGPGDTDCEGHDADYNPRDWKIAFEELLRLIQFYNAPYGVYHREAATEDGFAPGPYGILYGR